MTTDALNTKAIGMENEIPDITSLVNKAALKIVTTEIEIKILDTTNLVTKAVLNMKVT